MKGDEKTMIMFIFCIFLVLLLVTGMLRFINNATEKEHLYDGMVNPLVLGAEQISTQGAQKFANFLEEATSIFTFKELERECSKWYRSCASDIPRAPISPWAKYDLSEDDLDAAIYYLDAECRTDGIDKLKERWSKSNTHFAEKSDLEQYNLIKNACLSILIEKLNK